MLYITFDKVNRIGLSPWLMESINGGQNQTSSKVQAEDHFEMCIVDVVTHVFTLSCFLL